ncbi:hypothetical protein IFM89_039064 [Coptis chinensis]|uniref:Uncharacterized protein n=1 Tax=Coptis chinensis TaxID=261450 RepID=A0A835I6W8_9MAGN|nr:hypothetical protein IFM89_039064 [Coptis chinensis]
MFKPRFSPCFGDNYCGRTKHSRPVYSSTLDDGTDPSDSEDDKHDGESSNEETGAEFMGKKSLGFERYVEVHGTC